MFCVRMVLFRRRGNLRKNKDRDLLWMRFSKQFDAGSDRGTRRINIIDEEDLLTPDSLFVYQADVLSDLPALPLALAALLDILGFDERMKDGQF